MSPSDRNMIRRLQHLNDTLWYACEQAEAHLVQLQGLVERLFQTGILHNGVLLGAVILHRNYSPQAGGHSSGQLVQAALAIPGGFGVILWDTEDYAAFKDVPEGLESEAPLHFVAFADCEPALRALSLGQIGPLLVQINERLDRSL